MKYIDSEKLKERIEKLDMESCISEELSGFYYGIERVLEVIDSLQQEQPEVDLEKEYKEYVEDDPVFSKLVNRNVGLAIARHFFNLRFNARKENK